MKKLLLPLLMLALCLLPSVSEAGSKTLHDAATANATGSNISVEDKGMVGLMVTVSGTATITTQGSADGGVTWESISCTSIAGSTAATTITATGQYLCQVGGLSHFQAPLSGCSGCTVTVKVVTSAASLGPVFGLNANGDLEVALTTLIACEDQTNHLCMVSGGKVRLTALMTGVTGNATGSVVQLPTGSKTIQGILTCNAGGSTNCGITITIYGSMISSQVTGTFEQLCQLIIPTGAARTTYTCNPITGAFPYIWATTTGVAGTSPSLDVTGAY